LRRSLPHICISSPEGAVQLRYAHAPHLAALGVSSRLAHAFNQFFAVFAHLRASFSLEPDSQLAHHVLLTADRQIGPIAITTVRAQGSWMQVIAPERFSSYSAQWRPRKRAIQ
jgi:hypothetical protein